MEIFLLNSLVKVSGLFDVHNLDLAKLQLDNKGIWNGIMSGKIVLGRLGTVPQLFLESYIASILLIKT